MYLTALPAQAAQAPSVRYFLQQVVGPEITLRRGSSAQAQWVVKELGATSLMPRVVTRDRSAQAQAHAQQEAVRLAASSVTVEIPVAYYLCLLGLVRQAEVPSEILHQQVYQVLPLFLVERGRPLDQ